MGEEQRPVRPILSDDERAAALRVIEDLKAAGQRSLMFFVIPLSQWDTIVEKYRF